MANSTIEIKPGFKPSPIGPIPIDWDMRPIINFGTVVTGNTPSRQESKYWGGNICWATAQDFKSKYITETVEKITDEGAKVARILPKGSVLVTCIASIGSNAISSIPLATNQQINSIIPNSSTIAEWIYYCFENSKQRFLALAGKTAVPIISKGVFEKVKIQYAPLPEQQKIATILSTWDDAISKTQQLITQLKKRNSGLFQQLLLGKVRIKGYNGKWNFVPLKNFAKERSLKNRENVDLIVLSCTKYKGLVSSLEYFGRQIFSKDISTYKIVPKDCFAYATNHIEEGSIGLQSDYEKALISPMYTVFKTDISVIDNVYLYKVLKSHNYIHEYQKRMEGSIDRRGGLRWDEFSKIKVPLPAIDEQKEISKILDLAVHEIEIQEQKIETLKQQKKGLMQKLLTGEIRVKLK